MNSGSNHEPGEAAMKSEWVLYTLAAGLAWGTYVPLIFYGGSELGGKSASRILAILCVGIAYFVIAVLFPLYLFLSNKEQWPELKATGLVFSGLAGVAGAIGALCVVFASKSAVDAARAAGVAPATYRLFIAPLIFGLAPVINTLISLVWHPQPGQPFHFGIEELPGWRLWLGIIMVGAGAFLVLYAKEEAESGSKPHPPAAANPAAPST
jgi:drug/metabolite transporter (DMT)-like permease